MSSLIGGAQQSLVIIADEQGLWSQAFKAASPLQGATLAGFATPWWPGNGGLELGDAGDVGIGPLGLGHAHAPPDITRGSVRRFLITGTARDQFGAAASGATVYLYHTADGVLVDTQTCDQYGYYLATTPYFPDTHFVVAYQPGGGVKPDIFGTTVNTLVGA